MKKTSNKKESEKKPSIPINRCHLYGLKSPHALAKRIGWNLKKLKTLTDDSKYRVYKYKKTNRIIQEPCYDLQRLHRQLHKYLSRIETPNYLHSSVKGRSYISNARAHVGNESIMKIDISKFYRSVPQYRVMHFFRDVMKCVSDVAGLLANLICYRGFLATGSSVSPLISYYSYKFLFDNLAVLAENNNLIMTCYVDDITMSGSNVSRKLLHEVRLIISRSGLHPHKDRFLTGNKSKIVTGVVVGKDGINVPHSRWKKVRHLERKIKKCSDDKKKEQLHHILSSRYYEMAQIEPKFRPLAENINLKIRNKTSKT